NGIKEFSAYISVGDKKDTGFSLFRDGSKFIIDDVIDAGIDEDEFFSSKDEEADYYKLINELRNPGRNKIDGEKVVSLYTARPRQERNLYEGTSTVPSGIFATTSFQEAEGYMLEFGGER